MAIGAGLTYSPLAPLGVGMVIHGADQTATGLNTIYSNAHQRTLTTQALMKTGLSEPTASMIDMSMSLGGSIGGVAYFNKASNVLPTLQKTNTLISAKQSSNTAGLKLIKNEASVIKVGEFSYTTRATVSHYYETVKKGANKGSLSRPYMRSPLTIEEIVKSAPPMPDPKGKIIGGLWWEAPGTFNGRQGNWELLIDPKSNTIYHFLHK